MSKTTTIAKIRPDRTVVEILADGREQPFPEPAMRPMTPEEIETAARADPDARPMTPEEMQSARRVPRIKTLRRGLGLTQEEFATRYRIPLGTLRDWEQGRSAPDQPARAYLTVIAHDPEGVRWAFQTQRMDFSGVDQEIMTHTEEWEFAPKNGSVINAQFPDGKTVTKTKWNALTQQWEVPRRGKWSNMRDVHGAREPVVWWP